MRTQALYRLLILLCLLALLVLTVWLATTAGTHVSSEAIRFEETQ